MVSPYDTAIGDILGIVNCLRYLGDADKFLAWLRSQHGRLDNSRLFDGYKFTINTLVRMLCNEIANNYSLSLSEDHIFSRARFAGISLTKVPNTCEKSIILRNIYSQIQEVLTTKEWETMKAQYAKFYKEVVRPLDGLELAAIVSPSHGVETIDKAVDYCSMFQTYIFLNDTQRGLPHGYLAPMFEEGRASSWVILRRRKDYLNQVFDGYKYSVQFLWHCLLGPRFEEAPVARLHESRDWKQFDQFFEIIRDKMIRPLEAETSTHLGFDPLVILQESPKQVIRSLIEHGPPEPRLSQKDSLDRLFLWYEIQLIDSSDFDFTGVATFVPLLIGLIERKRQLGSEKKLQLVRLIHGSPIEHRRDYSYAVLVELYGKISDYSGWLLFYDCCSDAGSTSESYRFAEQYISRYLKDGLISISERCVDKKRFLSLMRSHLVSLTREQMYERRRRKR